MTRSFGVFCSECISVATYTFLSARVSVKQAALPSPPPESDLSSCDCVTPAAPQCSVSSGLINYPTQTQDMSGRAFLVHGSFKEQMSIKLSAQGYFFFLLYLFLYFERRMARSLASNSRVYMSYLVTLYDPCSLQVALNQTETGRAPINSLM